MQTFFLLYPLCLVVALTWAALKEDKLKPIVKTAAYYFGMLAGGMSAATVVMSLISYFIQPGRWP